MYVGEENVQSAKVSLDGTLAFDKAKLKSLDFISLQIVILYLLLLCDSMTVTTPRF